MAPGSPRFYFRGFHRDLYRRFDRILAVSERDREQFLRFGVKPGRITAAGDTRFDQVIARCRESATHDLFPDSIFKDRTVLVAGSTWPKDEEYLIAAIAEAAVRHLDLVAIVVPHEPTEKHLQEFEEASRGSLSSIRFSRMASYNGERVILVDGMGMLVTMYKYAHVVYVGGGFGAGIHNVLEPAVYGVPVLIGPNHQSSNEARALLERRGIAACDGRESMAAALGRFLADPPGRRTMGEIAKQYVNEKAGATEAIVSYLLELK
jgi:3-deoxy-D-manno-octulosonic-acid transferase